MDDCSYVHAFGMDADEVYKSDPLFMQYKIKNFRTNFKNLKEKVEKEKECIEFDQVAFDKEKAKYERNPTTLQG
jgi:hypothetical protein